MDEFHAQVNFYSPRDAVNAFYKLQGSQIYKDCCELHFYFTIELICGCRPHIPSYKLDYERSRAPIIPWQHSTEDYKVSSQRFSRKQSICYLEETNLTYLETHEREVVIREIKEETFLDEPTREHVPRTKVLDRNMLVDVEVNSLISEPSSGLHT